MKTTIKNLIVILGPTAVGKTDLSIELAEKFQGEIISADSRLLYRGMDIGTAKPSQNDRTRVPHHLIDVADPDQEWSLGLYLKSVNQIINQITERDNLPFLVGGTGQYIQALVEGWVLPEVQPNPAMRQTLELLAEEIGPDKLREQLMILDPDAADAIDGPNLRRMVRALEVILSTGQKFSEQKRKTGSPYRILQIGLTRPREELYQRVDERIGMMLESGLVNEVASLLDDGYDPKSSAMSAIGYKQIANHLLGMIPLEEAVRQIQSKTHKYVRHQANWFKHDDPNIRWFSASNDPIQEISDEIQQFLS